MSWGLMCHFLEMHKFHFEAKNSQKERARSSRSTVAVMSPHNSHKKLALKIETAQWREAVNTTKGSTRKSSGVLGHSRSLISEWQSREILPVGFCTWCHPEACGSVLTPGSFLQCREALTWLPNSRSCVHCIQLWAFRVKLSHWTLAGCTFRDRQWNWIFARNAC